MRKISAISLLPLLIGVSAAGCSSSSSSGTPVAGPTQSKTATPPTPTPSVTPSPVVTVTITQTPTPKTTTPVPSRAVQNLDLTATVTKQLVKAGAATHQLPASDFTGLVPGESYYAYDPETSTYWAGAGLVPSSKSQDAQVSVQDDGSYLVFKRTSGGTWVGYNVGLAGIAGSTCQVTVPAAVVKVWHWKKELPPAGELTSPALTEAGGCRGWPGQTAVVVA